MRIIAGKWRGHGLRQPPSEVTRPTTDRVREALFSSIESRMSWGGARVLDAFAGSGALGLEALSRGAARAVLCDANGKALAAIKANVASLPGAASAARIVRADVLKRPPAAAGPFDLVLLDPPYAYDAADVAGFVAALDAAGALDARALVCYEHPKDAAASAQEAFERIQWEPAAAKRYGDIAFDIYRRLR